MARPAKREILHKPRVGGVRQNLPRPRPQPAAEAAAARRPKSADPVTAAHMRSVFRFTDSGKMSTLDRSPFAVDQTDARGNGNHMVRLDVGSSADHRISKDQWMYTELTPDRAIDRRTGELYEDAPGHTSVELGGTVAGTTMRQASYDYGANKILQRKELDAQPYHDGVRSARDPPPEPRVLKPKPGHVDRNRSAVRIMALPFSDGMDAYATERWKTSPGCWEGSLREASWASKQPCLKVPKRWVTTTNSMQAGDPGEASFR